MANGCPFLPSVQVFRRAGQLPYAAPPSGLAPASGHNRALCALPSGLSPGGESSTCAPQPTNRISQRLRRERPFRLFYRAPRTPDRPRPRPRRPSVDGDSRRRCVRDGLASPAPPPGGPAFIRCAHSLGLPPTAQKARMPRASAPHRFAGGLARCCVPLARPRAAHAGLRRQAADRCALL